MANHRHDAGREKRPAGVIPRKRFGQHFLADRACIDAIVQDDDQLPGLHARILDQNLR